MSTDNMPDALDTLLARSAPPVSPPNRSTSRAVSAVIRVAELQAKPRASRRRRALVFTLAGAGLIATSGAALYTVTVTDAWMPWGGPEPISTVEWQVTLPSGIQCIDRLSSNMLTDDEMAEVEGALQDPAALLAADDGAVRTLFLTDFAVDGVDMEPIIDKAYAAFAALDIDAGRRDIQEADLGNIEWTGEDDIFKFVYMRLVEDSVTSSLAEQGVDLKFALTPETLCVVAQ